MVQILPRTNLTFGEQIAAGMRKGSDQNFELQKMSMQGDIDRKLKEAERAQKIAQVEAFKKSPAYENLSSVQKFALENEVAGLIGSGSSKSLINAEREGNENQFLSNLFSGEGATTEPRTRSKNDNFFGSEGQNMTEEIIPPKQQQSQSVMQNLTDNQLDMLMAKGGKAAELGKAEKNRRIEEKKLAQNTEQFEKKEITASFGENSDFINKTYDQYEDSLRKEAILDRMGQLESSDELSDSGIINFLKQLGFKEEWLKNPRNEEYTKLGLDLLGGGSLQADYGSRVLASEFMVSQQRVPTLSQTPEGRRQISENLKTMLLPSRLKQERLQYYLDQAERTGKPLPHNLRGKILSDIKPQLEEAYDKFKQRNGRYQVKKGTPLDDNSIEKYYYISQGNEKKARQMMKEDGYDVESK